MTEPSPRSFLMTCQCENIDRLSEPPCYLTSQFDTAQLVVRCDALCRGRFFVTFRPVYTDGACTNNSTSSGPNYNYQRSVPVDDAVDSGGKWTSRRAELLTALEGLKAIGDYDARTRCKGSDAPQIVVATDSEYIVKGIMEWFPGWNLSSLPSHCSDRVSRFYLSLFFFGQANDMRKQNGQRPSNLDLFIKLDAEVVAREERHACKIVFRHIGRGYNAISDGLTTVGGARAAMNMSIASSMR